MYFRILEKRTNFEKNVHMIFGTVHVGVSCWGGHAFLAVYPLTESIG
jgi:hypothetical protein